ncbi:hypothetical protein IPM62_02015 [Candidatus Woesebacteria bacterium]|nr:MAG: hypothetical protein IPM62_02015 [Candidatus Woesebacteria bacterium]
MDNSLLTLIDKSPLSPDDKEHWKLILPKLTDDQKEQLHHSLSVKIDIASAKAAIDRALKIIADAEAEAGEYPPSEDVTNKAKEEITKEIETNNPMMVEPTEITKEELTSHSNVAQEQLEKLRAELAQISLDAHGAPPPSATKAPTQVSPGSAIPQ